MKRIIKRIVPDKIFLQYKYYKTFKKRLNLKNPITFNEKLQWLKLYDRKDIYTTMVDKYDVKKYISNTLGEQYIIPTVGIYNSFDEIDLDTLPKSFVIKLTHDSGGVFVIKDKEKANFTLIKKEINKSLKSNFYYLAREWPYKNIKPRILIEEYMEDAEKKELIDYKFFCFNGECKCILVCSNRNKGLKETFFDARFNLLNLKRPNYDISKSLTKPINIDKMLEIASTLSKDIPFVRVDLYEINNKVYFGELTFYPAGGFNSFEPDSWDYELGKYINISKVGNKNEK